MDNKNIDPTFENFLNYSYVKGVKQIIEIQNRKDFVLNTRFTKYVLQLNNNDFELFADSLSQENLKFIIKSSFGNKYEKISKYLANFKKLIKLHNSFLKSNTQQIKIN